MMLLQCCSSAKREKRGATISSDSHRHEFLFFFIRVGSTLPHTHTEARDGKQTKPGACARACECENEGRWVRNCRDITCVFSVLLSFIHSFVRSLFFLFLFDFRFRSFHCSRAFDVSTWKRKRKPTERDV